MKNKVDNKQTMERVKRHLQKDAQHVSLPNDLKKRLDQHFERKHVKKGLLFNFQESGVKKYIQIAVAASLLAFVIQMGIRTDQDPKTGNSWLADTTYVKLEPDTLINKVKKVRF